MATFDTDEQVLAYVAERYGDGLADHVVTPVVAPGSLSVWAQYTVLSERRDESTWEDEHLALVVRS